MSQEEKTTHSIKEVVDPREGMCICGHSGAAHGSKGMICAACSCKQFIIEFDPKFPALSKIG